MQFQGHSLEVDTYSVLEYEQLSTYESHCVVAGVASVWLVRRRRTRCGPFRVVWFGFGGVTVRMVRRIGSWICRVILSHSRVPRSVRNRLRSCFRSWAREVVVSPSWVFFARIVVTSFWVVCGVVWPFRVDRSFRISRPFRVGRLVRVVWSVGMLWSLGVVRALRVVRSFGVRRVLWGVSGCVVRPGVRVVPVVVVINVWSSGCRGGCRRGGSCGGRRCFYWSVVGNLCPCSLHFGTWKMFLIRLKYVNAYTYDILLKIFRL